MRPTTPALFGTSSPSDPLRGPHNATLTPNNTDTRAARLRLVHTILDARINSPLQQSSIAAQAALQAHHTSGRVISVEHREALNTAAPIIRYTEEEALRIRNPLYAGQEVQEEVVDLPQLWDDGPEARWPAMHIRLVELFGRMIDVSGESDLVSSSAVLPDGLTLTTEFLEMFTNFVEACGVRRLRHWESRVAAVLSFREHLQSTYRRLLRAQRRRYGVMVAPEILDVMWDIQSTQEVECRVLTSMRRSVGPQVGLPSFDSRPTTPRLAQQPTPSTTPGPSIASVSPTRSPRSNASRAQLHRTLVAPGVISFAVLHTPTLSHPSSFIHIATFNWNHLHINSAHDIIPGDHQGFLHVNVAESLAVGVPLDYLDAIVFAEIQNAVERFSIELERGEALWDAWIGRGDERMTWGEVGNWDD